ncbi:MAG: hypothetical protein ACRYFZ_16710 [Janthinobacterium lividum]
MIKQVPGKIFLADQRGLVESSLFRRQSTFNFGAFQNEHKQSFGRLYGLNEETLAGGHAVEFVVAQDSYIVLLPITGAVEFSTGGGASGTAEVEQIINLAVLAGTTLRLCNPFAGELVSVLHIWLQAPPLAAPAVALTTVFGQLLEEQENELLELLSFEAVPGQAAAFTQALPFALSLGRFMGRQETGYKVKQPGNSLFAFIIAGAFELEGRLMHEKDGVALWQVEEIELEALSNHALVLVLELA